MCVHVCLCTSECVCLVMFCLTLFNGYVWHECVCESDCARLGVCVIVFRLAVLTGCNMSVYACVCLYISECGCLAVFHLC